MYSSICRRSFHNWMICGGKTIVVRRERAYISIFWNEMYYKKSTRPPPVPNSESVLVVNEPCYDLTTTVKLVLVLAQYQDEFYRSCRCFQQSLKVVVRTNLRVWKIEWREVFDNLDHTYIVYTYKLQKAERLDFGRTASITQILKWKQRRRKEVALIFLIFWLGDTFAGMQPTWTLCDRLALLCFWDIAFTMTLTRKQCIRRESALGSEVHHC